MKKKFFDEEQKNQTSLLSLKCYLSRVLSAVYEMLGVREKYKAKELFKKMDKNMDGKVSKQEFIDFCKREKDIFQI